MKNLLFFLLTLALPSHAAEQYIQCPARYPADDITLPQTGEWSAGVVQGHLRLESGGMFTGPLVRRAELQGRQQKMKDGFKVHFGFDIAEGPQEKWFRCYYGRGGDIQLVRRVADGTKACTLTHKEKEFPDEPEVTVRCK